MVVAFSNLLVEASVDVVESVDVLADLLGFVFADSLD
jgi:hypothetical protein